MKCIVVNNSGLTFRPAEIYAPSGSDDLNTNEDNSSFTTNSVVS